MQITPRAITVLFVQSFLGPPRHTQKQLSKWSVLHMKPNEVKGKKTYNTTAHKSPHTHGHWAQAALLNRRAVHATSCVHVNCIPVNY